MNRPKIDALGCDMRLPELNGIFSVFAFLLLKLIVNAMKVSRDDATFKVWDELPKFFKASENADIVNSILPIVVLLLVIFFFVKIKAGMSELATPLKNLWTAVIASLSLGIFCEFISILLSGGKESHLIAASFFSLIFLLVYTVCQGLLGYRLFSSYNGRLSTLGGWMMASSVILFLLSFSAISYLMDSDSEGKYESVTEVVLLGLFSAIPVILSFLPVYIAYRLLYYGIKDGATEPQSEAETITQPIASTTQQHDSRRTMQQPSNTATETIKTNKSTMKWALIAIGGILAAVLVFFVVKATVNALISPQQKPLKVKNVDCNETALVKSNYGKSYHARNLFDGDLTTSWQIDPGYTLLNNYEPFGVRHYPLADAFLNTGYIDKIVVYSGNQTNESKFYENSRPRKILIYASATDSAERVYLFDGILDDSMTPQTLHVGREIPTPYLIGIDVVDYYPGSRYSDICISEIEFYGK